MPTPKVTVVSVGCRQNPPGPHCLNDALSWYADLSNGAWTPRQITLGHVELPHDLGRYMSQGGADARGPSTRDLVQDVIGSTSHSDKDRLAAAGGNLVLIVPDGFRPHVWTPRRGGVALGRGSWCTRYAVLPASAPLGTQLHELAHLYLGWDDGVVAGRGASLCLMALGATGAYSAKPNPPAAPLLLAAGWRRPITLTPDLTALELATMPDIVACLNWCGRQIVVEVRANRLIAWTADSRVPDLVNTWISEPGDTRPILGRLAPALRRLPQRQSSTSKQVAVSFCPRVLQQLSL